MTKVKYEVDGREVIVYYDEFDRAMVTKQVLEELLKMADELMRLKRSEGDGKK